MRRLAHRGLVEYRLARGDTDMVVIEPQQADYWPQCDRNRGTPTTSRCHGSLICGGAATTWCWNRPAPARCFGFAIPPSRASSSRYRRRRRSAGCGGRMTSRGWNCSPCCWIAKSFSRSTLQPAKACAATRATRTSCFGTFTTCCFTSTAPKAGRPTRWAGAIPMWTSSRRRRPCGRLGPDRRSIWGSSRARPRSPSRRSQGCCANGIPSATSTTRNRSSLRSWPQLSRQRRSGAVEMDQPTRLRRWRRRS